MIWTLESKYGIPYANGMKEMMDAVQAAGGGPADMEYAGSSFTYSWSEPQDIIDNIDYIFHTHANSTM